MQNSKLKPAYTLTVIIIILMIIESLGGLLLHGLYRDNTFVTTTWVGNDFITLVLAVPLLTFSSYFSIRGSLKAQLIWMGMLDYTLYNYAFYLFGASFNKFFLLYVALFTLSIYALVLGLSQIDVRAIGCTFKARTPVKLIAIYMIFIALGLTSIYSMQSINFIINGVLPGIVKTSGHPTSIVFALDLSLLIPLLVLSAVLLWNRKPWGYTLSAMVMIKGLTYTLILSVNSILYALKIGTPVLSGEAPLWITLTVASTIAAMLLLNHMKSGLKDITKSV